MCSKVVLLVIGRDLVRNTWAMPLVPPVGALALGSYLASHGVECEIVDVAVDFGFGATVAGEHAVHERVAGYLQEQASRIAWVGISQLSNNPSGVALAREVRAALPNTPILCGGYFPSTNYDTLLRLYPFVTAVVRGDGEVFATIGYGDNRGEIRGFALAAIEAAYTGGTALNWTDGTPLTGPGDTGATSGAGMFFDPRGFLFAGGNEGVTVFAPDGRHRSYDLVGYYTGIEYDPAADRFITLSDGKVYDAGDFVPEPCSLVLLGLGALAIRRRSMQYMEIR